MVKQLSKSVREYKKPAIRGAIFVVLEVLTDLGIPIAMGWLVDFGIDRGSMSNILKFGVLLIAFCIASLVTGILSGFRSAEAAAGFGKNLRTDLFSKIQEFSFENIDKFSSASLITRLTTDVNNIQTAFQMIIRTAVRAPVMMIFATIFALTIKPSLAAIYIIIVPIVGLGLFYIINRVHPIFERVFTRYDDLNQVVQENVHGIRVVKSFVQEEQEIKKFSGISQEIYEDFTLAEKILAFNGPLMQTGVYACMLFISYFAAKFIVVGDLTTGNLMSLTFCTMQILMSLMLLTFVFVLIVIARSGAERCVEILTETSTLQNGENPVYQMENGNIVFENVDFSYSGDPLHLALSGVNLNIQAGQTVGIIGGTGSSKTSLVQLIPRLYDITAGRLTIGGVDVANYDLDTLRNEVAMVLQKNVLFSGTVAENLRWGNKEATQEELEQVATQAQAHDFIIQLDEGYESRVEQGGTNFSGGQRQRLCIARALLKNPKILILDDSTSAVDTKTDAHIRKAFREDFAETTKIIIAQRVSSVEDADQIVVLEDGQINAIGSHQELMETSYIYQEVYNSQNQNKGGFHE